MVESRSPYGHAAAFAAALLLYAVTLAPTAWFWDSGEQVAAAATRGIPHPPGNPFVILPRKLWIALLSATGLSVAVRMNLLAAVFSAAATGILRPLYLTPLDNSTRRVTTMRNAIRMFHVVLLAGLLAACGGDDPVGSLGAGSPGSFEAGPLGAVEVGEGEAVHIRSLHGCDTASSWLSETSAASTVTRSNSMSQSTPCVRRRADAQAPKGSSPTRG